MIGLAPKTRADCLAGPRPCPWASCKHHLGIPHSEDDRGRKRKGAETCSLDVADEGGKTLEEVGDQLGVTRERARQILEAALVKIRPRDRVLLADLAASVHHPDDAPYRDRISATRERGVRR